MSELSSAGSDLRCCRLPCAFVLASFFGTRHLVSEATAHISAARYLARRSALSIVLAALVVVALHFVEKSWAGLISDVGLKHTEIGDALERPVDRGTYSILLQSVAAVTGVFLALYFTAVSTVAATVYTGVSHDIRNLMVRDKLGNIYVRAVAFLSALSVFLLVEEASGGAAYHLALPIVALLAGFAIFAFITLGQRAFYFSDPTVLSDLVVGEFLRWFRDATARGWRWGDPSFQEEHRKRGRRALQSLIALLAFSRSHEFLRDQPERNVLSRIVFVLRVYLTGKATVPTKSRWFGETYEHRQWYLTDSTAVSLANQTASQLTPTTVPDVRWVEKTLLDPVLDAIGEDLRANRGEAAYIALTSLPQLFEEFGKQFAAQEGIEWVVKASENVLEAISHAPEEGSQSGVSVLSVASIDMLAGLAVSIEVGLYRRLSELDVAALKAKLEAARWARDESPYEFRLPRAVVETLEELHTGVEFEDVADSEVRTPNWYVAEIALNRLAWSAHDEFGACLAHVEAWYPQAADRLNAVKRHLAAGAVLAHGLELAWKLARHLESLPTVADQLGQVGALNDLRRPQWDWPGVPATGRIVPPRDTQADGRSNPGSGSPAEHERGSGLPRPSGALGWRWVLQGAG
jgi:hypothetical protein